MLIENARDHEFKKYEQCYKNPKYRMGNQRKAHIEWALSNINPKESLLDVGTGRGETLNMAEAMGFSMVQGIETVDYLCDGNRVIQGYGHELPFPDKSFQTVTMFDVMEHLVPEDTKIVCKELERVAKSTILLTVHNGSSSFGDVELHINRRPSYDDWYAELKELFSGTVEWLPRRGSISEMFKVTYGSR